MITTMFELLIGCIVFIEKTRTYLLRTYESCNFWISEYPSLMLVGEKEGEREREGLKFVGQWINKIGY